MTAEFRGPGIHHYNDDEDYEMDMDQRTRNYGSKSGQIILLGDGTEVLTDSANDDMDDHDEDDDKDVQGNGSDSHDHETRSGREGTPGPADSPSSTKTNDSTPEEPKIGGVADKAGSGAKEA